MTHFVYSLSNHGSTDQNLEKMIPLTERIFDILKHMLDMCTSKSFAGVFPSVDKDINNTMSAICSFLSR